MTAASATGEAGKPGLLGLVWPFWLLFSCVYLALRWPHIAKGQYLDPDDELRVVQVRDLLAGQPWFDLHHYRINPPDGIIMHWSRLVDLPLAVVQVLLRPLVGAHLAEQVAVTAMPLVTFAAILLLLRALALRLMDRGLIGYCAVLTGISFPIFIQIMPTRIDHHGWQIVAALAALLGLIDRLPRRGGMVAGLAVAIGMAISLEQLPIAVLFGGVFLVKSLRNTDGRLRMGAFSAAVLGGSLAAFAMTRGPDFTSYCDAVSPVYLAPITIVCIAGSTALLFPAMSIARYLTILALAGILGVAMVAAIKPLCLAGPFSNLDPLLTALWYNNVAEGRPLFTMNWVMLAQYLVPALFGLGASALIWSRAVSESRELWLGYTLVLAGAVLLGIMVTRSMAYAAAFSVVPGAWVVRGTALNLAARPNVHKWIGSVAIILCVIMPALPVQIALYGLGAAGLTNADKMPDAPVNSNSNGSTSSQMMSDLPLLNHLPTGTIFAPLDIGPTILLNTAHSVVATGHHRGAKGMHDIMTAMIVDPPVAHYLIAKHKARYVVVAPEMPEYAHYLELAPGGFAAQLKQGKVPPWLVPVPAATTTRVETFAVRY